MAVRIVKWIGGILGGLLLLAAAALWMVDTGPGHRLLTDRIAALKIVTGLRIHIGRIDGSIWHRATLRDVRLYDTRGLFLEAPEIALDWRPLAWAGNRLAIESATADLVTLTRLPVLRATGRPGTLPGFDIHIGRLAIRTLSIGPAVAGRATVASLEAKADIADRRAMIAATFASRLGDRIAVHLDAAPDADRFDLAAHVASPAHGLVAGLAGLARPLTLDVGGRGSWAVWNGTARATLSGRPVAALALAVRDGHGMLAGRMAPAPFLQGKLQRLTVPSVRVQGDATLADRQLKGALRLDTPALRLTGGGTIDLAEGAFRGFRVDAFLLRPTALFPNMTGRDIRLTTLLDGRYSTAAYRYRLATPHVAFDDTGFDGVVASGAGRLGASPVRVPIRLGARRVTGVGDVAGGILGNLRVAGILTVTSKAITGRDILFDSDKLKGRLGLTLDLATGTYGVDLTGGLAHYLIPGLGLIDVTSELRVVPGAGGHGTMVAGKGRAWVRRLDNSFFRTLAGGLPQITTGLVRTPDGVMHFDGLVLTAPAIRIAGSGIRRRDGTFQFKGRGTQATYGPFTIALDGDISKPKVDLVFDHPLDALGLSAVRATLDPTAEGFAYRAAGGSTLGPFASTGRILLPPAGAAVIAVDRLAVSGTNAHGALTTLPGGFDGTLAVAGGGLDGTVAFHPQGTLQRIDLHLAAAGATLALAEPVTIRRGRVDGALLLDPAGIAVDGKVEAQGLRRGALGLSQVALTAGLRGGVGRVAGSLAGARGRAFRLQGTADIGRDAIAVNGGGTIDRQPLKLVEPARIARDGAGWRLSPTRFQFAGGGATVAARFGEGPFQISGSVDRMPLTVLDMIAPDLGLGGAASGRFSYLSPAAGATPTGSADLTVRGLTRSGLVLASTPIDLGVVARLDGSGLAARAIAASKGKTIGRAQLRAAPLGGGASIADRLYGAPLFAQLRYNGPADALWRLIGVETIDLSGPLSVGADVGGTLADPQIRGVVRASGARLESAVSGTVIQNIAASGRFDGARLLLDRVSGTTPGGGSVAGSGSFGFSAQRGFTMDVKVDAKEAQLLNRDDIGATVTGPLTLKSDRSGGLIGGDVILDRSRFRLGRAAAVAIPRLAVTEINRPADGIDEGAAPAPWRLALKAKARNRLMVSGLGLDSEWRADLAIGGTIDNPAIGGQAVLLRGGYEFAGRRFDLDRGQIRFTGEAPADPLLDIVAKASIQGLSATIHVTGTGLKPDIAFESVPALPEDELLSRLLFGTSITNLSAPEALQLAAAVASLRNGGGGMGLDPINAIRKVAGLDRLRILPADVTTGQGTSVAAGKYIGHRTYVELITDGAGYSATRVEFQITRWLSLLSTVSTIGRQSANVRISKDY